MAERGFAQMHYPATLIDERTGHSLSTTATKCVILIHGWNPDGNPNCYSGLEWSSLLNNLKARLNGSGWGVVAYDWHEDAATGGIFGLLFTDFFNYGRASAAAYNAGAHGFNLAIQLNERAPNLREVHFIAHSAGSWAARKAMEQLLALNPYVVVQVTLLDPFVPSPGDAGDYSDVAMGNAKSVTGNERLQRLENYYANDFLIDGWNAYPFGSYTGPTYNTQETFVWRGGIDITERVDWGAVLVNPPGPNSVTYFANYDWHSGPIQFYSDCISASLFPASIPSGLQGAGCPFDFQQIGWERSLYAWETVLPQITTQPANQFAQTGESATFTVTAGQATSYEWYKVGGGYVGSGSSLTLTSLSAGDAGSYVVRVSNANGQLYSQKATLTIGSAPSILTPPQNRSVPVGASASFSVTVSGVPPFGYQWQRDNIDIPGATGPTYITPVLALGDSGAQFRVRVSNAFGSAFSSPATLTVTEGNSTTWTGAAGDGNWFNRTNWNPMTVPTASDLVQINSGNVSIPANAQYAVINLAGGSLNGTFTLTGLINWTGGTFSGGLTVAPSGVLTLSGTGDKVMSGGVITNGGTIIWSGGNLPMSYGSAFENLAGGVFDVQTDATMYWTGNGTAAAFDNAGTFRKSAGSGTTTLSSVNFNNAGTLDLLSGSLVVSGGFNQTGACTITAGSLTLQSGGTCQGSFDVSASSSLQLAGGSFVLSPNVVLSGPGLVRVSNAGIALNGSYNLPNFKFDPNTTISGTNTLSGAVNWAGGTLTGDMTIAPNCALTLSGSADKVMSGVVLRNSGTIIWSGGNLPMSYGSSIENLAGAVFSVQTDATIYWTGNGTAPVFNNAGTFRKSSGAGTLSISSVVFNNTGTVDVVSGTANFASNNLRLQPGSQLTGTGRVIGSVTLTGNVAVQNLELTTGTTLTGTGTLSGTITWTAGTLSGDVTIAPGGVLTLSGAGDKRMSGGVLRNGGTIIWSAGNLPMEHGSVIENLAGAMFDVQTSVTMYWTGNGTAPVFNNAGTIQVETGVLTFSSVSPQLNTGTTVTGAGRIVGTLTLNGNVLLQNFQLATGCTLAGTGTGTVQGTMLWTDGLMAARVTLTTNCVLTLSGSGDKVMSGGVITNGGTIIWSAGNLPMSNGSSIENLAGGAFDVQTDATMYWTGNGTAPVFNNAGTFRKSAGPGTTTLSSVSFNNAGTLELLSGSLVVGGQFNQTGTCTITAGTLTLPSGGTCQGTFDVSASSSLQMTGGGFILNSNVVFSGPGLVRVSNAGITLNGSYNLPNFKFDPNTTISGTNTLSGTVNWAGGTLTGDMTIAPNCVLTLSGSPDKVMSGAVLRNSGTIIWSGGNLPMSYGSSIENSAGAVFNVQTDATMYWTGNGTAPVFNNAGTFRKSSGAGTLSISSVTFNNTGTVDVLSGTANFASNNLRLQPGSQLTGTGRVIGSVTLNGNVAVQNLELVGGTTLTGTGTLSGTITWTAGTLSGDVTIAPGGVLTLSSSADKVMNGAVLRNSGTIIWSAGNLPMSNGSSIENLAGGVFDVQTSVTMYWTGNGTAPVFNNAGMIQVETGVLTFSSVSPQLNTGTTVTGAGRIVGTLMLNGNVLLQNFQLATGCTLAGTGTGTVQGTMLWTDGVMAARVTLMTNCLLTLSGSADKVMSGGTITNGGTIIWSGTGNLPMSNGSSIENLTGGVFDVQTDATMYWPGNGTAPEFNNGGTFRKSAGSGTTTLSSVNFNNAGTLELLSGSLTVGSQFNQTGACAITAGTLTLQSGGTCQGSFDVSASSSLQLAGGSFVLSSNVVFSGPGLVRVSNAGIALNGSYNLPNFKFDTSTTITGTNTLSGAVNWAGGTLTGDMTIAPNCVLTLSGSADKVMSSAVLRNAGTVIWSGTGNLPMNYGSVIENLAGAVFNVQTDATMYWPGNGTAPIFNNAGTFRKSSGAGTLSISSVTFNNTGTVDVLSGTANFASNNLRLQPGSQLTGTGRVIGSITLNGNVAVQNLELVGGTTLTGTGTLSGTINWTGGTLAGDVTIAPGGVLTLSGSADKTMSGGVLRNGGTIIWSGTGNLPMNYGSIIENLTGGMFDVKNSVTMYWPGNGTAPVFNNAGTIQVEAGVLTCSSVSPQLNTGTTVTGAGRIVGTLMLNGNVLLQNFQLATGCTLAGTGTVQGTMLWTDGLMAARVTLTTNCVLTLSGSADKVMSGGSITNGGTIIWSGTGNLPMNYGSVIENLAGGVFDVQTEATMYWPGNGTAPEFNNGGTFRKTSGSGTTTLSSVSFNNAGTLELLSGTVSFNNGFTQTAAGTLQVGVGGLTPGSGFGRLAVNGQATLSGALDVTLINGFTPGFGDAFSVLSYNSRSGNFASINLPALPNALALTAQYNSTSLTLLTVNAGGNNQTNAFQIARASNGMPELRFTGEPNHTYRLQASTNLVDWLDISTNTPVNGLLRFVDPDAVSIDHRFYRAVSP